MNFPVFLVASLLLLGVVSASNDFCIGVPDLSYVRSRNTCYLYYSCINGVAYPLTCAEGLYFSLELQRCVPPAESDCDIEEVPDLPEAPAPEPSPMCEGVSDYRYLADDTSCGLYFQCIDGIAYRLACPRYNIFSYENQRCGSRYEFTCDLDDGK